MKPIALLPILTTICAFSAFAQTWPEKVAAHHGKTPGGALLLQAIDAHGGLERFLDAGSLHFRWTYHMTDRGPDAVVDTHQTVDPHTLRAVHQVEGNEVRLGWTGSKAWIFPADASFNPPPRFWALTPYYFVAIPFVFADVSTTATLQDDIEFEGKRYQQVKITYAPGSGDAPDDYYILLINPETKHVKGARYIVTSSLVASAGPRPEKLITLEKTKRIKGVLFPTFHRTFSMDPDGGIGKLMRTAEVRNLDWVETDSVDFAMPDGAKEL